MKETSLRYFCSFPFAPPICSVLKEEEEEKRDYTHSGSSYFLPPLRLFSNTLLMTSRASERDRVCVY
jgi:hypothetical protein